MRGIAFWPDFDEGKLREARVFASSHTNLPWITGSRLVNDAPIRAEDVGLRARFKRG